MLKEAERRGVQRKRDDGTNEQVRVSRRERGGGCCGDGESPQAEDQSSTALGGPDIRNTRFHGREDSQQERPAPLALIGGAL